MLVYLYKLYTNVIGIGNPTFLGIRYKSIFRLIIRSITQIIMPIYYTFNKYELGKSKIDQSCNKRLIVSMTSFPARINNVWQVIESLIHQVRQPDIILLYLSKEQFPNTFMDLPAKLIKLQQRGLKIEFVEGDIRSHKKYHYAFKEFYNDLVITVDDDIYYHPYTIDVLYNEYIKYPSRIIANNTAVIKYRDKVLLPYLAWDSHYVESEKSGNLLQIGIGGVLYDPSLLFADVFDIDLAIHLCPLADDIWLNAMARLNKVQIHQTSLSLLYLPVYNIKDETLNSINNGQGMNDKQIQKTRNHYLEHIGFDVYSVDLYSPN